ncbi:alpha/beta fold hydrolase [Thalassoroseus pseudoceratinae]|uniref:alpha/beta fold hydrolase n=1 Tax=Thalassoroseus pseudoceratinae TaxID=2713176 RepID=UPI0014217290|nr:alpha/beta fold hydrolase [Thalassoroseus pseudoceratinae]
MSGQTTPVLLKNGPKKAKWTIALAHGAGASMSNRFMDSFAEGLADKGFQVVRFEFPYMAERGRTGRKRPPDREAVLRETWKLVIESLGNERLIIGGKSMGGRIASLVADEFQVAGLVCLGYPFHPSGKPDKLRIEHLQDIQTPTLILQGTRDKFGDKTEVDGYALADTVRTHWLPDGDHSFQPGKNSDRTVEQNYKNAIRQIVRFIAEIDGDMQVE